MHNFSKVPKDYFYTVSAGLALGAPFILAEISLVPCPVHTLTGAYCPGCGTQRAIRELLAGDLAGALSQNALIFAFPILFFAVRPMSRFKAGKALLISFTCVLVAGFVILRNLPGHPLAPS